MHNTLSQHSHNTCPRGNKRRPKQRQRADTTAKKNTVTGTAGAHNLTAETLNPTKTENRHHHGKDSATIGNNKTPTTKNADTSQSRQKRVQEHGRQQNTVAITVGTCKNKAGTQAARQKRRPATAKKRHVTTTKTGGNTYQSTAKRGRDHGKKKNHRLTTANTNTKPCQHSSTTDLTTAKDRRDHSKNIPRTKRKPNQHTSTVDYERTESKGDNGKGRGWCICTNKNTVKAKATKNRGRNNKMNATYYHKQQIYLS